jgi:hypothetical protein
MFTLLIAAAIAATPVSATPGSAGADPAAEIARALTPRESFRAMILMTLDHANAGAEIAKNVGAPRADALLAEAAEEISFRYADQWEANLADAYRKSLSPTELADTLEAIRRADRDALAPLSVRVGGAFFRNSEGLLRKATTEAIQHAAQQADKHGPAGG